MDATLSVSKMPSPAPSSVKPTTSKKEETLQATTGNKKLATKTDTFVGATPESPNENASTLPLLVAPTKISGAKAKISAACSQMANFIGILAGKAKSGINYAAKAVCAGIVATLEAVKGVYKAVTTKLSTAAAAPTKADKAAVAPSEEAVGASESDSGSFSEVSDSDDTQEQSKA